MGGIRISFILSAIAAVLACVIVVVAVNYIFKNKRRAWCWSTLLFPWLLPTILICYSYRTYFNSNDVWYVGNTNLYYMGKREAADYHRLYGGQTALLLRMIKAAYYAIDEELEDAARNLGASGNDHHDEDQAAHYITQRAGGLRAQLQRLVHGV